MAYMQLGAFVVPILSDSGQADEPDVGGVEARTFAGNLRSSRRWVKRQWRRRTMQMPESDITALLAIIGTPMGGNVVPMTGTIVKNIATNVLAVVTSMDDVRESNTTIRHHLNLWLREV